MPRSDLRLLFDAARKLLDRQLGLSAAALTAALLMMPLAQAQTQAPAADGSGAADPIVGHAVPLRLDMSDPKRPAVYAGEQLVAAYVDRSGAKPIIYPLQTVGGRRVVRDWPMVESQGGDGKRDHVHHRSMWFSYGDIDGVDYWAETAEKQGSIDSRSVTAAEAERSVAIQSLWDWKRPDGSKHLESSQSFTFQLDANTLLIDTEIVLTASEQDLRFGDTKEGAFAVRVADPMAVQAKKGGEIVNAESQRGDAAWGQISQFVQYTGPVAATTTGGPAAGEDHAAIAILVHPDTFGYPGRWHVRTYGLFAHNPFGVRDFAEAAPTTEAEQERLGGFTLKRGESLRLKYRTLVAERPLPTELIEKYWNDFADR